MTLTDHEARELLAAAADTIEVSPTPIPTPVRRPPLVPVAAAAALVGLVAGVALWHGRDDGSRTSSIATDSPSWSPPTASATPGTSRAPTPQTFEVPNVLGLPTDQAEERLRGAGFSVETTSVDTSPARPCSRGEYVTSQRPAAGLRPRGVTVRLVLGCTDPVVADDVPATLADTARAFISFADGGGQAPRWAPRVSLTIGGEEVGSLDRATAGVAANWRGCPASGSYAARTCPFSSLSAIPHDQRASAFGLSITTPPTKAPNCMAWPESYHPNPARAVAIQPTGPMVSCVSNFVVTLFLDAAGQVERVDLMLSEP
ncbi:PASTA domain-containing protein [Nocardioides sp.]|uniref:PASTA domain-containing protein n=1 Tax=Nocardioides sp. TaxID=35761 RepID=UPI0039E64670